MSIAPARNPMPRKVWRAIKTLLAAHGVAVDEITIAICDDVGDEYATFAVLYAKEP